MLREPKLGPVQTSNFTWPNLIPILVDLRAAVSKYRLGVCKMKKSKIPKICQNIGLGKLFLEKQLLVRLERLRDQFSQAQDHNFF